MKNKIKYEFLSHTADLKIRAYGKDWSELFSNMLCGMFESIGPEIVEKKEIKREIKISSSDLESLLVDFLSEALYLSDIYNEAYFSSCFKEISEKKLSGEICGYKIRSLKEEIKAVTWHELKIKKINSLWQAEVVFDI